MTRSNFIGPREWTVASSLAAFREAGGNVAAGQHVVIILNSSQKLAIA